MSKEFKFIWIDDDPERSSDSTSLSFRLGIEIDFKCVKDKKLTSELESIMLGEEPDLIIIDHKLEDVDSKIFKTGSSSAALIREKWPACPIVCMTGITKNKLDSRKVWIYDEVFQIVDISKTDKTLVAIAEGFRKLKKKPPQKLADIIERLKAPKAELKRLEAVIPKVLKENFNDSSLIVNISGWIRRVLFKRPGFLYDRLWTSTLLGLNENGFQKVEDVFVEAKYSGVFNDESNERWWKSEVLRILSKKVEGNKLPWEKGQLISGLNKGDFSKCYVSNSDFPEVVAFIDESESSEQVPMLLKYTERHPNYEDLLYFDEIRIMKAAE